MEKELLYQIIEETAPQITDLSDRIWSYAELSMQEHRSTAAYVEVLKDEGFTVQENLCGIATAFSGSFGSGRPVIGLLGEFDALSGLSQAPGLDHPQPLEAGGCGHGCGHNLLGAGALSAAIAIKRAIAAGLLHGTVVFYGCPGEEGCAGKTFMARDGMFRDLDAALTWHPGDTNEVTVGSNAASIQIEYSFSGIAAHAADDPWNGRSALDAAELMNVGVQFLREHMPPRATIHYAFSDAGCLSPNVVQPTARLIYMIRGATVANAKQLAARVADIAKGAALMTGTTVTSRQIDGTANTLSNQVLEQVLYNNLLAAPLPQYTPEEMDFAQRLKATFGPTPARAGDRRESPAAATDRRANCQRNPGSQQLRHSLHSLLHLQPGIYGCGRRELADPHRPDHRRHLALRQSGALLAERILRKNQSEPQGYAAGRQGAGRCRRRPDAGHRPAGAGPGRIRRLRRPGLRLPHRPGGDPLRGAVKRKQPGR